jgi:hypothetical protein
VHSGPVRRSDVRQPRRELIDERLDLVQFGAAAGGLGEERLGDAVEFEQRGHQHGGAVALVVGCAQGVVLLVGVHLERADEQHQGVDPALVEAVEGVHPVAAPALFEGIPVEPFLGDDAGALLEAGRVEQVGHVGDRCLDERLSISDQGGKDHVFARRRGQLGVFAVEEHDVPRLGGALEAGADRCELAGRGGGRRVASGDPHLLGGHRQRHPPVAAGIEPVGRAGHDVDVGFVVADPRTIGREPAEPLPVGAQQVRAVRDQPPPERRQCRVHPHEPSLDVTGVDGDRPGGSLGDRGDVAHAVGQLGEGHVTLQEPLDRSPAGRSDLGVRRHGLDEFVAWHHGVTEGLDHGVADVAFGGHGHHRAAPRSRPPTPAAGAPTSR